MKLKPSPRWLDSLLISGAVLLFVLSFAGSSKSFDIHVHDTYYVIDFKMMCRSLAVLLFLIWGAYRLCARVLIFKLLSFIHVFVTLACVCLIVISVFINTQARELSPAEMRRFLDWHTTILPVMTIVQFLFVIHLIAGVIKTRFTHSSSNT